RTPFERLITPMKQHDLPSYQRIAADTEIEPAGRAAIGHDRVQLALLQHQHIARPGMKDELDAVARFGKNRADKSGQSAAVAARLVDVRRPVAGTDTQRLRFGLSRLQRDR